MVQRKRGRISRAQKSSSSLQQPNLWVILSVALLVIGLTVITSLGPSSVTGNTVQNIARMNKGDPLQLSVSDVPGLLTVFTNANEIIRDGKITVVVDENLPFNGKFFSKFTVTSENKWGTLRFTFKIKEQDLLAKGISRGDLRLYHGVKEYALQLLKVDHGYLYYVVTVPSMGNFVLGKFAAAEKETVVTIIKESPETVTIDDPNIMKEKPGSLVGRAAGLPSEMEGESLWARIAQFFRNLFS
ncbi:MAG: hypothetical protein Q7S55_01960 [Nanoarchaeota archaeon]|nr:hypothetical protein [Nanoarchaeota archaeon]